MSYTDALAKALSEGALPHMEDPIWASLLSLVTPETLKEAHAHAYATLCERHGIYPALASNRDCKSYARVQKKATWSAFKAQSDFAAVRLQHTNRTILQQQADDLRRSILDTPGGIFQLKPGSDVSFMTDIVVFAYVWTPEIKYIMEIQIGHPFAGYTFAMDSRIRDYGHVPGETIDLWNGNVYPTMRNEILHNWNYSDRLKAVFDNAQKDNPLKVEFPRHLFA